MVGGNGARWLADMAAVNVVTICGAVEPAEDYEDRAVA